MNQDDNIDFSEPEFENYGNPYENDPLDISKLLPPHSVEAEQSVIGGLLLANHRWDDVVEHLSADDFYRDEHRQIFRAMEILSDEDHPIDVVTLQSKLSSLDVLERIGGLRYLAELAENTPSAANIQAYAHLVQEKSITRKLLIAADSLETIARNPEGRNAQEIIEEAERELQNIAEGRTKEGGPRDMDDVLQHTIKRIEYLVENKGTIAGLATGFKELDEYTNGLHPSDLVIVAARPAMGKTAFSMNLVEAALLKNSPAKPAIVFSMEMSAEQLMLRLVSATGRINQGHIKTGSLADDDWPKLSSAMTKLKGKPLYIDDTPGLTPTEIRARTRRIHRMHGEIGIIMIDYIQLMQVSGRSEGRTAEISEISRSLKGLAKEFNCPVVALSQLNRSVEQRPNKRPIMSDIRESGAIEQDADIILFLYRDDYYDEESEDKGLAEIIISKHRAGETGTVKLAFHGQYTRFDDIAADAYNKYDEF